MVENMSQVWLKWICCLLFDQSVIFQDEKTVAAAKELKEWLAKSQGQHCRRWNFKIQLSGGLAPGGGRQGFDESYDDDDEEEENYEDVACGDVDDDIIDNDDDVGDNAVQVDAHTTPKNDDGSPAPKKDDGPTTSKNDDGSPAPKSKGLENNASLTCSGLKPNQPLNPNKYQEIRSGLMECVAWSFVNYI